MRLINHCFEVIVCLMSLFYYIATIKFLPGLCDKQVTLQSHVETAQCRHKPIRKFTSISYEGNLSCLTNLVSFATVCLMPSRRAIWDTKFRSLPRLKLKVPNYPKPFAYLSSITLVVLFPKLNNSLRSSDKRLYCAFHKHANSEVQKPIFAAVDHLNGPLRKQNFTFNNWFKRSWFVFCDWWISIRFVCFCVSRFVACDRNYDWRHRETQLWRRHLNFRVPMFVKSAVTVHSSFVLRFSPPYFFWFSSTSLRSLRFS